MNAEQMTAKQFAAKLGDDLTHLLPWLECTATSVDSTGGGCTVTRVQLNDGAGRFCSLVVINDEQGAIDGNNIAEMYSGDDHRDGCWIGWALYNADDWNGSGLDWRGTDLMQDRPFKDYAILTCVLGDELNAWHRWAVQQ